MKRKVVVAFFVSSMLSLAMLGMLFVTPVKVHHNYRSNKNDVNFFSNPLQNATDSDEIADTLNVSDTKNQDQYSLIGVYSTQHDMAGIYFDRSIYYPDVRVFWEPNLSVPIEIRVVDRDVNDNYVKVNVSSSIDSKEVTLTKDILGVFSGTVFAVGIRLMDEPISNTSSLNVRYGDEIIAEYFDMSSGNNFTASALFILPHYVMENYCHNPESLESASNIVFDSNGIPMVNYGGTIGLQYNPVTISAYALANYYVYVKEENTTRREKFLAQAKWLAENAKQKGNYSVWEYNFDWPSYGLTDPWVSAMSQGRGLGALARAYVLTGNISYIDVAEETILSFQVEMSAGGVRYTDSDGVWFEEAADQYAPSSKILNGFIFALLGLYEYSFYTNNSKGWTFFWEGTETLSNNIHRYDSGSWSYYDLLLYSHASKWYHQTHIEQLRTMYELTGDGIFLYYSDKFQSYIYPPPPPPPPPTPENTLTVYTLPSGVTFTVNNVPHITPWSEPYENGTLVSLLMPETHTIGALRYYWDQWSDGNTSRSRTFTMDTNITLAGYFTVSYRPVRNLDTRQNYRTIQEAINNASEGDRIFAFSGTYYEHVVVNKTVLLIGENRSNTIIDGSGQNQTIVKITASKVEISGFTIKNGSKHLPWCGIFIAESENVIVRNNIVKDNYYSILLIRSNNSKIVNNIIINNYAFGIQFSDSSNNQIIGNTIENNPTGVVIASATSHSNVFFRNNFIDNINQAVSFSFDTVWDNGYPSGGNYWTDYNDTDLHIGPYQNETGSDGIGDKPYIIDGNNIDRYPLVYPCGYVPSPDLNDDGTVNIKDIVTVAIAFGSKPGDDNWNPIADMNNDGTVNINDIVIVAIHFGEMCITIHVQYEDGTPIPDAEVEIFESETNEKVAESLTDGNGNFVTALRPVEHYGYVYGPSTKDIPPFTPTPGLIIIIEYPKP